MEKKILFTPAFDRHDPDPSKNYGIGSVDIIFVLIGDKGAVQFILSTDWHLPHVRKELDDKGFPCKPSARDIGYHSPKPMYEGQTIATKHCEYLGGICYYDSSALQADKYFNILVEGGDDALWKSLEQYYREIFDESEDK